ncbi:sialic acid-binding Ig-like lectin 15 [Amia ocellicauda]|uniref:sialic acid-binding Ig-like lectin 15 n=1 Tax=Amia ocellicauda TaxID=2972642 RepID=UPI0034638D06
MAPVLVWCIYCILGIVHSKAGWSISTPEEILGEFGKDVLLPCTFQQPKNDYKGNIEVIWRTKVHFDGPVIFHCVNSASAMSNCSAPSTETSKMSRYSLAGDARQNNLSLLIRKASFEDNDSYFCRVQLEGKGNSWETKRGTNLKVPPFIKQLYISVDRFGDHSVTCEAMGLPLPTIVWVQPQNQNFTVRNSSGNQSVSSTVPAILNETHTCRASNLFGTEERSIHRGVSITIPEGKLKISFMALSGILLGIVILLVIVLIVKHQGSSTKHINVKKSCQNDKDEKPGGIYMNMPKRTV